MTPVGPPLPAPTAKIAGQLAAQTHNFIQKNLLTPFSPSSTSAHSYKSSNPFRPSRIQDIFVDHLLHVIFLKLNVSC